MTDYTIRSGTEEDLDELLRYAEALISEGLPGIFRRPVPTREEELEFIRSHTTRPNSVLLEVLFAWVAERGIRRIEGGAFATNPRALELYRRLGFVEEGRLTGAVIRDGVPIDLIAIAKTLEPTTGPSH